MQGKSWSLFPHPARLLHNGKLFFVVAGANMEREILITQTSCLHILELRDDSWGVSL